MTPVNSVDLTAESHALVSIRFFSEKIVRALIHVKIIRK
jgi:hypothetical protein